MSLRIPETTSTNDEALLKRLSSLLAGIHIPSLRRVHIQPGEEYVVLSGEVNSFYAWQVLEHTASRAAEGRRIVNEVRVAPGRRVTSPSIALGAALLALAGLASGCGRAEPEQVAVHPVSGQVIFQGKPAEGAFVVFHSKTDRDKFPPPSAQVDKHGNFQLGTYTHKDGAPAGEYAVTVVLRKPVPKDGELVPGPNLIPTQYSKPNTTRLNVRIAEGANSVPLKIIR
jgi:hypothetical protein